MKKVHVPEWFAKELRIIDPTYRVKYPEDMVGFFIVKDVDLTFKIDDGKTLSIPNGDTRRLRAKGTLEVLWVPELNSRALDDLRQMKLKALELRIFDNPANELAYYQKLRRDAKHKSKQLAVDMITEGVRELVRLEKTKSFSYGGSEATKEHHGKRTV